MAAPKIKENYINELPRFVASNIRAEMARQRITQKTLASLVGLTQAQVSKRQSGTMDWQLSELIPVANALGVGLGTLIFGYENSPEVFPGGGSPNWTRTSNPFVYGLRQPIISSSPKSLGICVWLWQSSITRIFADGVTSDT